MSSRERTEVLRNAAWLLAQRAAILVGGIIFAVVMPRLAGPQQFGRYTLMVSVATWFFVASDLGCIQILTRYLPKHGVQLGEAGIRALFNRILALRVLLGLAASAIYLPCARHLLPDVPLAAVLLAGLTIAMLSVSDPLFCLFLGLQRAARWGMGFLIRRSLMLVMVPVGFAAGGLVGAAVGVVVSELLVMSVGLTWARGWFSRADFRPDVAYLRPYLSFGLVFFASAILHVSFRLGGEPLVRLIALDYAEVGYYGVMIGIYTAGEAGTLQIFHTFAAYLALLLARGEGGVVDAMIERVLRGLTAVAVPGLLAAVFLNHEITRVLFGAAYVPAARNLVPLSIGLLALIAGTAGNAVAMLRERPGLAFGGAVVRFGAFLALCFPLIQREGAFGAAVAMAAATVLYAGWMMACIRRIAPIPLRRWLLTLALGALPLPLVLLKGGPYRNLLLFAAALAVYELAIFLTRTVTMMEVRGVWQTFRGTAREEPREPPAADWDGAP